MPEPKLLLVLNHTYALTELAPEFDEIFFSPTVKSTPQESYFKKRFRELQNTFPNIKTSMSSDAENYTHVLCWDAFNEQKLYSAKIMPYQNRLLNSLLFKPGNSFTPFRKKFENHLPPFYEEANKPFDSEVIQEIHYYFKEKKLASSYFETRNGLVGRDFSTKFSVFLSSGTLDVRYLYNQVREFENKNGANKSTYWIIFELIWREFFYWNYQENQSLFFSQNGLQGKPDYSIFSKYGIDELKNISSNDFFLAALNELKETGFLSNRVRQIFASIWINDLKLNWRAGADLFETYLIDYDVYSNWGNWMYLTGVGSDPRGKRYFNLEKQLSTYDPQGLYLKKWR